MGVVISKTALNPLSLTSTIIGFVSFAFTLATFLRLVWTNIMTLSEAPHDVHAYLTNLRTELLEEKANIRLMRKNCRRHHRLIQKGGRGAYRLDSGAELDDVTLRTMSDAVRHLVRRFKAVEQPFLEPGEEGITAAARNPRKRRRASRSVSPAPYYTHSAYAAPLEKGGGGGRGGRADREGDYDDDDEDDGDRFWAQRTRYAKYGLRRRVRWLYTKSEAQELFQILSRLQVRRIARQVGGMSVLVHEYGRATLEMEEMVRRIDERMGRFVGVRRVNGSD